MNDVLNFDNKLDRKWILIWVALLFSEIPFMVLVNLISYWIVGGELYLWDGVLRNFVTSTILSPLLLISPFKNEYRISGDYFYAKESFFFLRTMAINLPLSMIEKVEYKHHQVILTIEGKKYALYSINKKKELYQILNQLISKK